MNGYLQPWLAAGVAAGCAAAWSWLAIVSLVARRRARTSPHRRTPLAGRWTAPAMGIAGRAASTARARRVLAQVGPSDARLRELALVAAGAAPQLDAAGGMAVLQLRELRGLQLACACGLGLLATRLTGGPFAPAGIVLALSAAWGGSMLPVWWLSARGARRMRSLRAVLPDGLELVRACVAGGLPLRRALAATAGHCREPLASELAALTAATGMGVPLLDAIDAFAAHNPLPEVRSLAVAIRQAERHGTPLAQTLGAIAEDARSARERAIANRAAAAAPQIQLIVAALLVPAALLELAALLIAAFARGELRLL